MNISEKLSNVSLSSTRLTQSNSKAANLAFNMSQADRVGLRIDLLNDRKDRNARQDLLRDSLNLRNSLEDIQKLIKKGQIQADGASTSGDATTSSSADLEIPSGELSNTIDTISKLSSVSSGQFNINGTNISIDITSDSFNDVVDRINSSGTGVTASFDTISGRLSLESESEFTIDDGDTNFFSAAKVTTGSIAQSEIPGEDGQDSYLNSKRFKDAFKRLVTRFNKVFNTMEEVKKSRQELEEDADNFKDKIFTAVEEAVKNLVDEDFEASGKGRLDYGMTFSFDNVSTFLDFDEKNFSKGIAKGSDKFVNLFMFNAKNDEKDGLLEKMLRTIGDLNTSLSTKIGTAPQVGLLINTIA